MSRKIECAYCQVSMGEIRDATLRKGTSFLCEPCKKKSDAAILRMRAVQSQKGGEFRDLFGGLF